MGIWGRTMNAIRAGLTAFRGYDPEALAMLTPEHWDDYTSRLFRYSLMEHYYHNTVYTELEKYRVGHLMKSNNGLYKRVRPIRNPTRRIVNAYPAHVYGGQIDVVDLKAGAIPFVFQNNDERLSRAILRLFEWSNWQQEKSLYVRHGAMLGDSVIKIVDERDKRKVRMEVLHPALFKDVTFDAVRNVKACVIEYTRYDEKGRAYVYREVIDQQTYRTFKDDKPFAFYNDINGNPVAAWDNEYGFVPVRFAMHMTGGARFGMAALSGVLGKIDELNAAASATHDQIGKVINPVWTAKGVTAPENLKVDNEPGKLPILNLGDNGELDPLVTTLQIADALAAIDAQYDEIKADAPELALAEIREHGNLTKPGIDAGWQDAIGLIDEAMGNYDAALSAAIKMAITIGGLGNYRDFESFSLNSYDNGEMDFNIKPRSVIGDVLSKSEKIQFLISTPPEKLPLVMREIGYSEKDIEEATAGLVTEQESALDQTLAQITGVLSNGQSAGSNGNGTGTNGSAGQGEQIETDNLATVLTA